MNESIHVVGSFILAGILLYGLWQGTRRRRRRHERKQASAVRVIDKINTFPHFGQKIAYLRKIDPFVFEELLLEGFERRGFEVIRNRRYTGDGGIDGRVKIDGQTWLIQAKRYTSYIAVGHVRDFSDLLNATGARGFFCHRQNARRHQIAHSRRQPHDPGQWPEAARPYCHRCAVYPVSGIPATGRNGSS